MVRDGGTGELLPVARAISVTEVKVRGLDSTETLENGGPGAGAADRQGRMVLGDLRPGVHDLEVHAPGYQTVRLEKVPVGAGTPIEASLRRVQSPGAVSVVIRGPAGDAVAGVRVLLRRPDDAAGRAVQSDGDGRVRFDGVSPGRHIVDADFSLGLLRRWKKELGGYPFRNRRTFELKEGEDASVELGFILGSSSMTVRAREGERPLPGLKVRLVQAGPPDFDVWNPQLSTGPDGAVTFARLRPGLYRVSVSEDDCRWTFPPWEVREAESVDRTIALGRAVIRGRLKRGGAVAEGGVAITGPGERIAIAQADRDGGFEIPRAAPGRYRLEAQGAPPIEVEVPPAGDPPPVEIHLRETQRG